MIYTLIACAIMAAVTPYVIAGFAVPPEAAPVIWAFTVVGTGAFVFNGLLYVSNAAFNTLGKPGRSTLVNWLREGGFTYPVGLGLAALFGTPGVIYTQAVLAITIGAASGYWGWYFVRGIGAQIAPLLDRAGRRAYRGRTPAAGGPHAHLHRPYHPDGKRPR